LPPWLAEFGGRLLSPRLFQHWQDKLPYSLLGSWFIPWPCIKEIKTLVDVVWFLSYALTAIKGTIYDAAQFRAIDIKISESRGIFIDNYRNPSSFMVIIPTLNSI
jgi:hypothetical protein